MLVSTLVSAVALFTASANALPRPDKPTVYTPARDLSRLATMMPESSLPAPDGQLKYVVLGVGTQNYTCTTGDPTLLPHHWRNRDRMAKLKIASISPLALALAEHPMTFEWSLKTQGYNKHVGTHEFRPVNGKGMPTFAFDHLAAPFPIAQVGKLGNVPAPASACPGLAAEGAVQWLYLKDTTGLSVGGIDTVYRLETAGGSAPATCKDMPKSFEVMYAAQYWVYGPRN